MGPPGLGSPGSWLDEPVSVLVPTPVLALTESPSTLITTAGTPSGFSRTSIPYTALTSELSPTPVATIPRPASRLQTRSATTAPAIPASAEHVVSLAKHKAGKRNLLNPMSLLRRRSSQAGLVKPDDLPEDFDPGIIYGTRHPDWSTPRNAHPSLPVISPLSPMVGADGKILKMEVMDADRNQRKLSEDRQSGFVECFDDQVGTQSPEGRQRTIGERGPSILAVPVGIHTDSRPKDQHTMGEVLRPPMTVTVTSTVDTLLTGMHDNEGDLHPPNTEGLGERRKGVTLVDHPLALPQHKLINSSRFSFEGSSSTPGSPLPSRPPSHHHSSGDELDLSEDEEAFEFDGLVDMDDGDDEGFAAANEGIYELQQTLTDLSATTQKTDGNLNVGMSLGNIGLAISSTPPKEQATEIEMLGLGLSGVTTQPLTPPECKITLAAHRRLGNPRRFDLDNDSDIEAMEGEAGLGAYEDELYFDDGIIGGDNPVYQTPSSTADSTTPRLLTAPLNQIPGSLAIDTSGVRISMFPQDGSMLSSPDTPQNFPPFLNPIGSGPLGFKPQNPAFYAPADPLNPLALSNLTYTLQQYQQRQQAGEGSSGYNSDQNDFPGGGYYSEDETFAGYGEDDDDDDLVAAANGEVLASDEEGWYGSEFGMFQNGQWFGRFDLSRGDTLRPPIRRSSLTPISERSESSYRNSLVFPSHWQPQIRADSIGNTDDLPLGQLLQLRKQQWSSSQPPSVSSGASSPVVAMSEGLRPPSMVATSPDGRESGIPLSPPLMAPSDYMMIQQQWIDMRNTVPPSPPVASPPPIQDNSDMGIISPPSGLPFQSRGMHYPPGLALPLGVSKTPPGLPLPGANAMLPTKGSFEDVI